MSEASWWHREPDRQPAFLTYGFRPFFLAAGAYAVLAIAGWIAWLAIHAAGAAVIRPTIDVPVHQWHAHEMIFGYAVAAMSGFMLTAVPSWTSAPRLAGPPLLGLAGVWLAGRLAMWFSAFLSPVVVMAVDMAYLPLLTAVTAAGLFVKPAPRNLVFLALLAVLFLSNGAVHWEWLGTGAETASRGLATALMVFALMVVIIGGRVVPAFTRNALMRRGGDQPLPQGNEHVDRLAILSAGVLAVAVMVEAPDAITAALAAIAAAANGVRLLRWRGLAVIAEPILWSLHLAYAMLVAGYATFAADRLFDVTGLSGEHLLGIGAIGGMTLAIMSRAALGHTGRPLKVHRAIAVAYGLVALAALVRAIGPALLPDWYFVLIFTAGGLWMTAFALFVIVNLPILTGPSVSS